MLFVKRTGTVTNFQSFASEILGAFTFFTLAAFYIDYYVDIALRLLILFSVIIIVHDYYRILTYPKEGEHHA